MGIRAAQMPELAALQDIERAATHMFADFGMPELLEYDPPPLPVMAARQQDGRLWVFAGQGGEPIGYLMADVVDGCLQIEQVTVHPGSARRGLRRALLDHAANRARLTACPR